jgi:Reverse transcriptase (RNA-dependent DNA polymerase)
LAPYVFTKILKPVLKWACRKGIWISAYLDDLLIVAKSEQLSRQHTQMVMNKLEEMGFLVKHSKSHLEPTHKLQHLGFNINTKDMTLSVPKDKVRDLRREATKIMNKGTLTIRALSSFIGKALAMTAAILPARLKTRNLVWLKNQALRTYSSWTASISLTMQVKEDLEWWIESLAQWNGQTWIQQPPQEEIYTDASDLGWGIIHNSTTISGKWHLKDQDQHINWKELQAVWHAINLPQLQGKRIMVYCDNTTTIAYINKFGGTRSEPLMHLAEKIWNFCLRTGMSLSTAFVPSQFNPADPPSRQLNNQLEWSISQPAFEELDKRWGPHQIDLFATHLNTKLPTYMSWKFDENAAAQNAMQQTWTGWGRLYICPPWNLLPQVLQCLQDSRLAATVITPNWTSSIWYPTIQNMAIEPPVVLPRSAVLGAHRNEAEILVRNPSWTLLAWNVQNAANSRTKDTATTQ